MKRLAAICGATLLLTASLASAQSDEPPPYQRGGGLQEGAQMLDFEVVSVDPRQWIVSARDVESRDEFQFRMPPQSFQGQRFTVDLSAARAGQPIEVRGQSNVKIDELVVDAPLGMSGVGGGADGEKGRPRRPDYSRDPGRRPPSAPDYAPRPPRAPSDDGFKAERGGPMEYRVESFDPQGWVVTARGSDGSTIKLKVDPDAFVGYRFRAPVRNLRRGQGFTILALNQRPIEDCCTLVSGGGR
ncbi:MAG: hypothetical protein GY769_18725 [bacterium]|nr:hypothetical protein [bacterium]